MAVIIKDLIIKILIFFKVSVIFVSNRAMTAISALVDWIKSVGLTKITATFFILSFVFKATYNFILDRNFSIFVLSIARVFVAAEHDIIMYISELTTFNTLSVWSKVILYINILGSVIVFIYIVKFLNGFQRTISSNSSLSGIYPTIISIGFIALFEYIYLLIIALSTNGGNILAMVSVDVVPLRGLGVLIWNIPALISPSSLGARLPSNETVEGLLNITGADESRGLVMTIICLVIPQC